MNKRLVVLLGLTSLVTGCADKYRVAVNGFLDSDRASGVIAGARIAILADDQAENPLFRSEVTHKVRSLLTARGYTVSPLAGADYHLSFQYGMDAGKTVQGSRPVHDPPDVVTIRRTDTQGRQSYSTIFVPGSTYYVPYSETVFGAWLVIHLYDNPGAPETAQKADPVWIGEIVCSSTSSDLRETINPMLLMAFDHFGENTGERIEQTISKSDPRLAQIKAR